jgi:hypothetical protein
VWIVGSVWVRPGNCSYPKSWFGWGLGQDTTGGNWEEGWLSACSFLLAWRRSVKGVVIVGETPAKEVDPTTQRLPANKKITKISAKGRVRKQKETSSCSQRTCLSSSGPVCC